MRKFVFIIFFAFFSSSSTVLFSQTISLNKNKVFIVGRGTIDKQQFVKKLNIENNYLTHIGIGFFENDDFVIYHVSINNLNNGSALIKEDYNSFISEKGVFYKAIWEINLISFNKIYVLDEIKKISQKPIIFDNEYDLSNEPNKLYCSEFVSIVINNVANNLFQPIRTSEARNKIIRNLANERLYYPADFFIKNKSFKMIYEYCK